MSRLDGAFFDLGRLDRLARQDTPVHRLDPRTKLLTTLAFLVCVLSFDRHAIAGLLPFALFPVALATLGRLPLDLLARRILLVAPFVVLVGLFNPFFEPATCIQWGPVAVSCGWVSFLSLLLRFVLTIAAALVLIATTEFAALGLGLQRLGVPSAFTRQLLFLHRYLFVLAEETACLLRARALRACGRRGFGMRVAASMIGQLLLRALERARRIHIAMRARGFAGEIPVGRAPRPGWADARFLLGWCGLFLLLRLWNMPDLLGRLTLEWIG